MVPTYQFVCQAREPIVFKQPEQEMLADSTVAASFETAGKSRPPRDEEVIAQPVKITV
jgi:hypothetical protein